jgi:hypothetical protein
MPDLNIGQQGKLKSTPKMVRINGDDNKKAIYRNMGNNHAYPFLWATTADVTISGTSVVVASGIKWHGYDLATYGTVVATPNWGTSCYVTKDVGTNVVTVNVGTAPTVSGAQVDIIFMLGEDLEAAGLYCRGNVGDTQSLP